MSVSHKTATSSGSCPFVALHPLECWVPDFKARPGDEEASLSLSFLFFSSHSLGSSVPV